MDLLRQVCDLLGELLVLLGEVRVRLKQLEDPSTSRLRRSLEPAVALLDSIGLLSRSARRVCASRISGAA